MSLKVITKVGAVNNLSDARYCAGMAVDFIGFDFDKTSDNYISIEKFTQISEWISGVKLVAEFNDASFEDIEEVVSRCNIDAIQVDNLELVKPLVNLNKQIILNLSLHDARGLPDELLVDFVIINVSEKDDKGLTVIQSLSKNHKVLLSEGITATNVESLVQKYDASGIALKGGNEIRPGFKDYDELADILEAIEEEY